MAKQIITGTEMYDASGIASARNGKAMAAALDNVFTTTASDGLSQVIAYQEIMERCPVKYNQYEWMYKGALEYGIGKTRNAARWKQTKKFDAATATFVPNDISTIEWLQTSSTNKFQRTFENDWKPDEIAEKARNAELFNGFIEENIAVNAETFNREEREAPRFLFGITVDSEALPTDFQTQLQPVKDCVGKNALTATRTDAYSVVDWFLKFTENLDLEYFDKYASGLVNQTGNIVINGTDTKVAPIKYSWDKATRYLIAPISFKGELQKYMAEQRHPEILQNFEDLFGKVIWENMPENTFILTHPDTFEIYKKDMSSDTSFYPQNGYIHNIQIRDYFCLWNPLLPQLKITFNK